MKWCSFWPLFSRWDDFIVKSIHQILHNANEWTKHPANKSSWTGRQKITWSEKSFTVIVKGSPQVHICVYGSLYQSIHQKPLRTIWLFVKSSPIISSWDAEVKDIRHVMRHVPLHQRGKKKNPSYSQFLPFFYFSCTIKQHFSHQIAITRGQSHKIWKGRKCWNDHILKVPFKSFSKGVMPT